MKSKYYFDFPSISLYGLICLGLSLFILFSTLPKEEKHITLERQIENLDFQDKGLYLTFINDDTNYVFYEFDDVKYDVFKQFKGGEKVIIEVEDDYQKFNYAIIKKMIYSNNVLFDSTEHYYNHNMHITNVFAPTTIALIVAYILIVLFSIKRVDKLQENINTKFKFVINNKNGITQFGIMFTVFGTIPFFMFLIQYLLEIVDYDFFCFGYVFTLFTVLGLLLIYVSLREQFKLNNGIYSYRHFFRKQTIKVQDIRNVEIKIDSMGSNMKIIFYDKKGKKAISFYDNGRGFLDGVFISSLKEYRIKYIYKTKKNEIYR